MLIQEKLHFKSGYIQLSLYWEELLKLLDRQNLSVPKVTYQYISAKKFKGFTISSFMNKT